MYGSPDGHQLGKDRAEVKVLVIAPHPFYQERGTPIDVRLVLRALVARNNVAVDLLTYHVGEDVHLPGLTIHRLRNSFLPKNIRPGFSLKKVVCDVFLFFKALSLARRNRYDVIHAGEESVFIAMFIKIFYHIPYAYDLDSSVALQMVEQMPILRPFAPIFNRLERAAVRGAMINLPVCNALADLCNHHNAHKTVTLYDISQLTDPDMQATGMLRREFGVEGQLVLYVGNLEPYQGIDLLIRAFHLVHVRDIGNQAHLIIVGGIEKHVQGYRGLASELGIAHRVHLTGPKPFTSLDHTLADADILVCPRIRGNNTPMKVFSYLHTGKPVLVTDLPTHNQILTPEVACLAPPTPAGFAAALLRLIHDEGERKRIGQMGRRMVEQNHTYAAHKERLDHAYDWIQSQLHLRD